MKKNVVLLLIGIVGIAAVLFSLRTYLMGWFRSPLSTGEQIQVNPKTTEEAPLTEEESDAVDITVEPFVKDLFVPWSILFTSPDRMLVSERSGSIRVVEQGQLRDTPLITFPEVSTQTEEGLMGLAADPSYQTNKYLYACLAYPQEDGEALTNKVVRLVDQGTTATIDRVLLENIPAARYHAGCRLRFGPDNKLYITTGDALEKETAQDLGSLGGKILRINTDGNVPEDNPFPNSLIWSYGHRNPQGIDWYPGTDVLYATEHGPSTFDGPPGGDEVNIIKKGANYGWPLVSHEQTKEGMVDPKLVFTPAEAPGSGTFYSSKVIPQFTNNFFFGALRGRGMIRVIISESNPEEIVSYEKMKEVDIGRVRDIAEGPDGFLYFASSNRDGRGDVRDGDDTIYRIRPAE